MKGFVVIVSSVLGCLALVTAVYFAFNGHRSQPNAAPVHTASTVSNEKASVGSSATPVPLSSAAPVVSQPPAVNTSPTPALAITPVIAPASTPDIVTDPAAQPMADAAIVKIAGQAQCLKPNDLGDIPRVFVAANATIPVAVGFPQGDPGEPVAIEAEDGGKVDGTMVGKASALDEGRRLHFDFQVNGESGIYRVVLRRGADVRMMNFWVGPPPPVVERN